MTHADLVLLDLLKTSVFCTFTGFFSFIPTWLHVSDCVAAINTLLMWMKREILWSRYLIAICVWLKFQICAHLYPGTSFRQKLSWKKMLHWSILCCSGLKTVNLHVRRPLRNDNAPQSRRRRWGQTSRSFVIEGKERWGEEKLLSNTLTLVSEYFSSEPHSADGDRLAWGLPESLFRAFNHLQEVRRHDVREIHLAIREERAHSVGKIYAGTVQMLAIPFPAGVATRTQHFTA